MSKLYDAIGHAGNVTCLKFGRQSGKVFVTGGEDMKVGIWKYGKSQPLMSLTGHASSIQCVTIDWPEEIVVAGSASGSIKLWDLEHAKVIRTLIGHKSGIQAVEFHPFGEFFASSADSTTKLWDLRRKGCIQTYQDHQATVHGLKITPDGRWIASISHDSTAKLWDMTAGKLIKTFVMPQIQDVVFSPTEFVMAAYSVEGDIVLYDLESFEVMSKLSTNGTLSKLNFSSDGNYLYGAYSDRLDIFSLEPLTCKSSVSVPWGNLEDLIILEGENKILGASFTSSCVSLWGAYAELMQVEQLMIPQQTSSMLMKQEETKTLDSIPPNVTMREQSFASSQQSIPHRHPENSLSITDPLPKIQSNSSLRNISQTIPAPISEHRRETNSRVARQTMAKTYSQDSINQSMTNLSLANGTPKSIKDTSTNQGFVPCVNGETTLNLTLNSFIPNTGGSRKPPMSLKIDTQDPLPEALIVRHVSFITIMKSRLHTVQSVHENWQHGGSINMKQTVEKLSQIRQSAVTFDLAKILLLRPKMLNLDMACLLLPLMNELLFEVFQDYIVVACQMVRLLSTHFGPLILDTLRTGKEFTTGLDIAREERYEKCKKCVYEFQNVSMTLDSLRNTRGKMGMEVKETIHSLEIFGG